jgi:hypothetical protein
MIQTYRVLDWVSTISGGVAHTSAGPQYQNNVVAVGPGGWQIDVLPGDVTPYYNDDQGNAPPQSDNWKKTPENERSGANYTPINSSMHDAQTGIRRGIQWQGLVGVYCAAGPDAGKYYGFLRYNYFKPPSSGVRWQQHNPVSTWAKAISSSSPPAEFSGAMAAGLPALTGFSIPTP